MHVEVDQSGRVEDTRHQTVLAFSNNVQRHLAIGAVAKRELFAAFRNKHKSKKILGIKIFSVLLSLLLEKFLKSAQFIMVDQEYVGYENLIKSYFYPMAISMGVKISSDKIRLGRIGKKPSARKSAIHVFRNEEHETDEVDI